jgi:cell division protein FtsB
VKNTYAHSRPVVNAYLVRERDRRLLQELAMVMAITLVVAAGLAGNVWAQARLFDAGYRIDTLERQLHELVEREKQLRVEVTFRSGSAAVEKRAVEELGMRPWSLDQLVFAEDLE